MILPLLLVVAGNAIAHGAAPFVRHETPEDAQEAGRDIAEAAEAVGVYSPSKGRRSGRGVALGHLVGPWRCKRFGGRATDSKRRSRQCVRAVSASIHNRAASWIKSLVVHFSAGSALDEVWFSLMAKVVSVQQSPTSLQIYDDLLTSFMSAWPDDKPKRGGALGCKA